MNSQTYLKTIAKNFGGLSRTLLEDRLKRLVAMSKREERYKYVSEIKKTPDKDPEEKKDVVIFSNRNKDEAMMNRINGYIIDRWIPITNIPDDQFNVFWRLIERRSDIIFNEDYQQFKRVEL